MSYLTTTIPDRSLPQRAADETATYWQATDEAAEQDAALAISCEMAGDGQAIPTGNKLRLDGVEADIPVGLRRRVRPPVDLPIVPHLAHAIFMPMTLEAMSEFLGISEEELTVFIGQQFGWRLERRAGGFVVPSQRWSPPAEQKEGQLR